ncbi:MAG TPA: hypothetical protein VKK79_04975 [Candidatus Lokiarchaeia archaeon]|nr:hypothetical protein [Candidatus Lokiarchaeia archaeon]
MLIDSSLLAVLIVRTVVLFGFGAYLFYSWGKAPRRYFSDFPFLMGVSFTALAASKIFDIILYGMFLGVDYASLNTWDPRLVWGYARWLLILVVVVPLLYANLCVWLANRPRTRLLIVMGFAAGFATFILSAQSYSALNAMLPLLVLPPGVLTVVTFLFAYLHQRLPNVHGLLVSLGWVGYIISSIIRPSLMKIGNPPWGLVIVSELIDMVMWIIIFLGFVLHPKFSQKTKAPSALPQERLESETSAPESNRKYVVEKIIT